MKWQEYYRDKTVVVTGGASGLGRAMGAALSKCGAHVYLVDIDAPGLQEAARGIAGQDVHTITADVTDFERMQAVAQEIFDAQGSVDVVINNAGMVQGGPAHALSPASFEKSINVNFWGVVHGIYAFLPGIMKQGKKADIVNLASAAGLVGLPYVAPYCASKSAVVGLTESLISEIDPDKVRFHLVCPGSVKTNVIRNGILDLPGNYKNKVADMMDKNGADVDATAASILKSVSRGRAFMFPAGGGLKALWWIKRLSWHLYAWTASRIGAFGRKIEQKQVNEGPSGSRPGGG